MIPVLVENLSKAFNTEYITSEFRTGNGVADLVFTTGLNDESIFFNDYGIVSSYVNLFYQNKTQSTSELYKNCLDKSRLKKLLHKLEEAECIRFDGDTIVSVRKYLSHTHNLFSIEAKLNDWKSGFYQALRYKFFSHISYLAYPQKFIHRVDLDLLRDNDIGLISVAENSIEFVLNPKSKIPEDITSYLFLSELFAQPFKTNMIHGQLERV